MKKSMLSLVILWLLCAPMHVFASPEAVAADRGTLLKVEDAGYPLLILTLQVGKLEKAYTLNLATNKDKNLNETALQKWIGAQVIIDYNALNQKSVRDVRYNNVSLAGIDGFVADANTKKMTGKIKASTATNGDLPGYFDITTSNGQKTSFSFFVTEEMEAHSGKTVVVFYENTVENEVISIKKAPNADERGTIPYKQVSHYSAINDNRPGWTEHIITSADDALFRTFNAQFSMGDQVIDFNKNYVIAIIGDETNKETSIDIVRFNRSGDTNILEYKVTTGAAGYKRLPQTMLVIDKKYLQQMSATKSFAKK